MEPRSEDRTARHLVACAAAIVALGGCQGPPPLPLYSSLEEAKTFGYAEKQVETTRYEVTYLTRRQRVSFTMLGREAQIGTMSRTAEEIAELRAAEIALEAGYPSYKIVDRRTDSEVMMREYAYLGAGGFSTFHRYHSSYLRSYPYAPAFFGSSAFAQVRTTLDVRMLDAQDDDGADAKAAQARLGNKYLPGDPKTADQPPG